MGLMDILGGLMGGKKKKAGMNLPGMGGGGGSMGGLESMLPGGLGSLMGGNGGLLKMLLPMLMGGGALGKMGGLGGLMGMLNKGGLGGKANSWVGTGPNEDITPDELESALGADTIDEMAREAGVSRDEARSGLASMLPKVINEVTPKGAVPSTGDLGGLIKGLDLKKLLG